MRCKTCGFARSNSCEAGQSCPPGPMTAPSRYKDWSPAAIFGGNSNDARVHPRGHLGGQSAPRSPGAQAAALASAWRGRGGNRGDGLLSALAEMNGIISDGVAEEEDRVAPADWRTRAKQHEKPRKAKPRRRPPAPTRSPDLASRQRQRQEQRMRAVHTIQRGWRARCVVDRTARQRHACAAVVATWPRPPARTPSSVATRTRARPPLSRACHETQF